MKTYTDSKSFSDDFEWLNSWLSNQFMKNVSTLLDNSKITVTATHIDSEKHEWDGELLFEVSKLTSGEIVNYLIQFSSANEIFMNDEKTLRLWWD